MREIVFDTETTGLDPLHPDMPDRIVEIGMVELMGLERTGRELHIYLNPERSVPEEVVRVHGLTRDFLERHEKFSVVADEVIDFVGDAPLVAHNAAFDQAFICAELRRCGRDIIAAERFIDTMVMARKKFPGASCSLDALAKRYQLDRYGFDLASRKGPGGHGALVDSRILAEIYLQLKGGREQALVFDDAALESASADTSEQTIRYAPRAPRPAPLPSLVTEAEAEAHAAFISGLGAQALWLKVGT